MSSDIKRLTRRHRPNGSCVSVCVLELCMRCRSCQLGGTARLRVHVCVCNAAEWEVRGGSAIVQRKLHLTHDDQMTIWNDATSGRRFFTQIDTREWRRAYTHVIRAANGTWQEGVWCKYHANGIKAASTNSRYMTSHGLAATNNVSYFGDPGWQRLCGISGAGYDLFFMSCFTWMCTWWE